MGVHETQMYQAIGPHQNIVRCFGMTVQKLNTDGLPQVPTAFIALEYIYGGGDLWNLVNVGGAFDEDVARFICLQLLEGLDHIHE